MRFKHKIRATLRPDAFLDDTAKAPFFFPMPMLKKESTLYSLHRSEVDILKRALFEALSMEAWEKTTKTSNKITIKI